MPTPVTLIQLLRVARVFAPRVIALAAGLGLQSGCQPGSTYPGNRVGAPGSSVRGDTVRPFSEREQTLALLALSHWHNDLREPALTYELDRYDRRIPSSLRRTVRAILPPVAEGSTPDAETHHTVAIERIKFPQENYAYVVFRVANRFDATEYVDVYQFYDSAWHRRDHFLVARGLMNTLLVDFVWDPYRYEADEETNGTTAEP